MASEFPLDSRCDAYGMADPISKPAWGYTIGSTPEFWLILSSQNDPLLGPQEKFIVFSALCFCFSCCLL